MMKQIILYIKYFLDAGKCLLEAFEKCSDNWPSWPSANSGSVVPDSKEPVSHEAGTPVQ